jgi:adenosylcobinamide kinase/adenosylcobinamide-phosphate guanylyltransferase
MRSGRPKTVTLVLGGARSGKSRCAQELASAFQRVVFIATARRSDAEMRRKIAEHCRQRPPSWKTIEAPETLERTIREEGPRADLVVVDCLTLYLANIMGRKGGGQGQIRSRMQRLCDAVRATKASMIIVSNEVGSGVVPPYRIGREYRDLLGELNQKIATLADRVIFMVAGLPFVVKNGACGKGVERFGMGANCDPQLTRNAQRVG